jgi:cell wall-associated NlpC family hydrolase
MIQPRPRKMALMLPRTRTTTPTARTLLSLFAIAIMSTGCASAPQTQPTKIDRATVTPDEQRDHDVELTIGGAVAELAMGMVGARYRHGGTDPIEGFDCSGLAFYAYTQAGYRIPRTSQDQFRAARKIALGDAGAGDLVFFQDEAKLSHVGIYLGDGRFVHAPASGQKVAVASMSSAYYQQHLVAVGRLLPPGL